MKIYHGTTEDAWNKIRNTGLTPRTTERPTNWERFPSHSDVIYLTRAYAPYFGVCALETLENSRIAVLELDFDNLDDEKLRPDEDFVGQVIQQQHGLPLDEATELARLGMDDFAHFWPDSLENLGQVAYAAPIPVSHIERVALFEPKANPDILRMFVDPQISPLNYQICKHKYLGLTEWLLGDEFDPETLWEWKIYSEPQREAWKALFANRDGVEVVHPPHHTPETRTQP